MTIMKKPENKRPEIDLTGPEGNAFVLMGYAKRFGKDLGMSESEINSLIENMKSSDYEHLVQVFDDAFGSYVTLYR